MSVESVLSDKQKKAVTELWTKYDPRDFNIQSVMLKFAAEVIGLVNASEGSPLDPNESDAITLWAEIHRLRTEVAGPKPYATWKEAAVDERVRRVKTEVAHGALRRLLVNEVSHAQLNDHRLVPGFGHHQGDLAVRISSIEACLDNPETILNSGVNALEISKGKEEDGLKEFIRQILDPTPQLKATMPLSSYCDCGATGNKVHSESCPVTSAVRWAFAASGESAQGSATATKPLDVSFAGGIAPSHYCKTCNAMWLFAEHGWTLRSKECGTCCDNQPMGEQIQQMTLFAPGLNVHWSERIRELLTKTGHENDLDLYQAFKQFEVELALYHRRGGINALSIGEAFILSRKVLELPEVVAPFNLDLVKTEDVAQWGERDARIKLMMEQIGHGNSLSLYQALNQLEREVRLEYHDAWDVPTQKTLDFAGYPWLPCPICNGEEGCDHAVPERKAAANAIVGREAGKVVWQSAAEPWIPASMANRERDAVYYERNQLVAALAKLFPAGIDHSPVAGAEPEWHNCVLVDLPTGQVSWHYHNREAHLFEGLATYEKPWDGHDTAEKYRRLNALTSDPFPIRLSVEKVAVAAPPDHPHTNSPFLTFKMAMRNDLGYAWTWHSTFAMVIKDTIKCSGKLANIAAAALMKHVFDLDVTKFSQWQLTADPVIYDGVSLDAALAAVRNLYNTKIYSDKDRGYNKAIGHVIEKLQTLRVEL